MNNGDLLCLIALVLSGLIWIAHLIWDHKNTCSMEDESDKRWREWMKIYQERRQKEEEKYGYPNKDPILVRKGKK